MRIIVNTLHMLTHRNQAGPTGFLSDWRLLAAACSLLLILKLYLAWRLDLYSDEVFYWLASTQPALAYSDLPFITALLAGLGSALDPGNPLATRILFLAGGSSLPAVIYWLAQPYAGHRDALQAAFLSICIPLGGFLGLLAVPDVPMLLFGLLSLGFLDRALRTDKAGYWLGAGVFMALGLCTHYRFLVYPAAVVLFLLAHTETRQWRNNKMWAAAGIAALGLLPALWANLPGNLGSASFYFVERHPWQFDAAGLLHLPMQALLVTPPLYALLLFSAWLMIRTNDVRVKLLLWFSLPHLLIYALLAPWADANSTTEHWPLPGYFPLLVFAPEAMRQSCAWQTRWWRAAGATALIRVIPLIGFAGALTVLAGIGSQSLQQQLLPILGTGVLSEKMAGWRDFNVFTGQLLRDDFRDRPVIITDNYYTAGQLEYSGVAPAAYTLDTDKAVRDGRYRQLELWRRTGEFAGERSGEPLLFITEDSTLNVLQKHELVARACGLADSLKQVNQLSLFDGDKQFSFYRGHVATPAARTAGPCPYPPRAWIDQPAPGASLSGSAIVSGWAYNEDLGVARVLLYLDGEITGELDYGLPRPDVVAVRQPENEPNQPNLGFQTTFDTNEFSPGRHELEILIIDGRGNATRYGRRTVLMEESIIP